MSRIYAEYQGQVIEGVLVKYLDDYQEIALVQDDELGLIRVNLYLADVVETTGGAQ